MKRREPLAGGPTAQNNAESLKRTPSPSADQAQQWSVVVEKRPGVSIVFSTRLSKVDADLIVVRLAAVGCSSLVVPMLSIDAPGMQRRPK
jgi:hypothetical protein